MPFWLQLLVAVLGIQDPPGGNESDWILVRKSPGCLPRDERDRIFGGSESRLYSAADGLEYRFPGII